MKPYNAIKSLLEIIENNLGQELNIDSLAKRLSISEVHLQRIFKQTFKTPLAKYIRLRKLSDSSKKLAFSDYRVIDVANEYGFEHEQSYIRAFKNEFNITPGQFKKTGTIIKSTPPFNMDGLFNTSDGLISMPDIVVIPEIHLVGKLSYISQEDSLIKAPVVAKKFWTDDKLRIKNSLNKNVYIGLTRMDRMLDKSVYYLSSVQASSIKSIPDGLIADKLPASQYLRFSYVGKHHFHELNMEVAHEMYKAISLYMQRNTKHHIERKLFFERVDVSLYDGTYCFLEWLTPISVKL